MGDGTKENPYTRKDLLKWIRQNGGTAEGLDLSRKTFEEEIDLCDLNLKGIILNEAVLLGAKFNGSNLTAAKLRKAKLVKAKFNQHDNKPFPKFANLRDTDLSSADLSEAEFTGAFLDNANFREANASDANFTIKERREPDLLFTDFRGANLRFADFIGRSFFSTMLEGAYLHWAKITEGTFLGRADWGNYKIGEENDKDFSLAAHRYRQFKVWYTQAGYHDTAAKFYYREKEAGRKALGWTCKFLHHRLALEASRLFFGYGERWQNILCWLAVVVLGAAAAYYLTGELNLLYSLYFSVISFTALGYGKWVDIMPQGWVQTLGAVESFLGVFMMALLLVTFVRKWTR